MVRIVSIDGGGYLGLATATLIEEIERHYGKTFHESFDLFCGTSTGAIIALALASGMTGKEVNNLYQKFGAKVFRNPFPGCRQLRMLRGLLFSAYSNTGLQESLTDAFGNLTLGDLRRKNKRVLVTSFCTTTGKPRVFKTDHSSDLTRDDGYLVRDVALASSAAPIYLPVVKLCAPTNGIEERYCDGGVFSNHPALLGYAEAVSHIGCNPQDVRILSLSTPRASLSETATAGNAFSRFLLSRGLLVWGSKLAGVMIDATSIIAHETLRRLTDWQSGSGARYVRISLEKPSGTGLDIATPEATMALRQVGYAQACQTECRNQLAIFFRN